MTYEPALDRDRLDTQLNRVQALMADGNWRTLHEIANNVFGSEAGVSARLRELRNKLGYTVERKRVGNPNRGLFAYRVVPQAPKFDESGQAIMDFEGWAA